MKISKCFKIYKKTDLQRMGEKELLELLFGYCFCALILFVIIFIVSIF